MHFRSKNIFKKYYVIVLLNIHFTITILKLEEKSYIFLRD
jgi:hypothetical protein